MKWDRVAIVIFCAFVGIAVLNILVFSILCLTGFRSRGVAPRE